MSERSTFLLLNDISTAITHIFQFTQNISFDEYTSDVKTRHAVERNFEIIGEAASRISVHFASGHPEIEWRVIRDFRNFIIHEYFGIDDELVWKTIKVNLPDLFEKIKRLLAAFPGEENKKI